MATKQKNAKAKIASLRKQRLREHIIRLGLNNETLYLAWCAQHGFKVTTNKSKLNFRTEVRHYYEHSAFSQLKRKRKHRKFAETLIEFCRDAMRLKIIREGDDEQATYGCQRILKKIRTTSGRLVTGEFLSIVNERSNLLKRKPGRDQHPYIDGLVSIASYQQLWVRTPQSWRPCSHNTDRQFESLVRHLLAKYSMPKFFDSIWFENSRFGQRGQRWYVQIALGQNPRHGESPVPLSAKMAHYFMQAPADCSVIQAIRWAQVKALGGGPHLFAAVRTSRLGYDLSNNDFWLNAIQFFVNHPRMDTSHVGPICDYLQYQKYEEQVVYVEDFNHRRIAPPHPNLCMKGRTIDTLLAQVKRWHTMLGRGDGLEKVTWKPSSILPMKLIIGKGPKSVTWTITQLLSHKALAREGAAMDHCVVTYTRSCISRQCSIWSMTSEDVSGNVVRRQTIELRRRKVVQCRGLDNRDPDRHERAVLIRWVQEANLSIDLPEY